MIVFLIKSQCFVSFSFMSYDLKVARFYLFAYGATVFNSNFRPLDRCEFTKIFGNFLERGFQRKCVLLNSKDEFYSRLDEVIRDLKHRRRGRQRERQETIVLISKTLALHVHYTLWYISLPSSAKQRREITKFKVLWRT